MEWLPSLPPLLIECDLGSQKTYPSFQQSKRFQMPHFHLLDTEPETHSHSKPRQKFNSVMFALN